MRLVARHLQLPPSRAPLSHKQIWSISNIFSAPGSPQRPPNERNNLAPPERAVPPPLPSGPSAWLYLNVLITQSQVGAAHAALWLGAVRAAGWWVRGERRCTSGSSRVVPSVQLSTQPAHNLAFDPRLTPSLPRPLCPQIFVPIYEVAAAQELCTELWGAAGGPRSEFERLADLALAVAAFKEADETGGQGAD